MLPGTKWRPTKRRIAAAVMARTLEMVPQIGWPSGPAEESTPGALVDRVGGVFLPAADLVDHHAPLLGEAIVGDGRVEELLGEQAERLLDVRVEHLEVERHVLVAGVGVVLASEVAGKTVDPRLIVRPRALEQHVLGDVRDAGVRAVEARAGTDGDGDRRERTGRGLVQHGERRRAAGAGALAACRTSPRRRRLADGPGAQPGARASASRRAPPSSRSSSRARFGEYGNHVGSVLRRRGSTRIACRTQNWRRPSAPPWRVPTPLCLTPPNGSAGTPAESRHSLTQALPLSMPLRERDAALDVARPHAGVQPVAAVVGESQRLVGVAHGHDRDDRAERLLAHDEHRVVDAGEHRRLVEASRAVAAPPAAGQHARALRARVVDVALDDLDLPRTGERAVVDVGVGAVRPDAQRPHLLDELLA